VEFEEAKQEFLLLWGTLGGQWGINRTMAQIHALLMISPGALSAEEVMEALSISRGNANMNLRELMAWNLVYKELRMGERKEFFRAEKDIWEVAKRVIQERRKREILPVRENLKTLKNISNANENHETREFVRVVGDISSLVSKLDSVGEKMIKADENWFFGKILKLMK
jgi:DNA-binding transcriptional regulator GbsR (MarR family)